MKEIPLSKGMVALVDDEDYDWLLQWKWHILKNHGGNYYARRLGVRGEKVVTILMHRVITNAPAGMDVDHIDGNGLNNTRNNLRICTHSQNSRNRKRNKGVSSPYRGVYKNKGFKNWQARIRVDGRLINLGMHETPELAAVAYDEAAKKMAGGFARLNFS